MLKCWVAISAPCIDSPVSDAAAGFSLETTEVAQTYATVYKNETENERTFTCSLTVCSFLLISR